MTHPTPTFPENLEALLAEINPDIDLDRTARETGALVRRRRIRSGSELLRLGLSRVAGKMSFRQVAAWSSRLLTAGISDVAVIKRLRKAANWFEFLVSELVVAMAPASLAGTFAGRPVRLVDGSVVTAPGSGQDWRLHLALGLPETKASDIRLTPRKQGESFQKMSIDPGALHVGDRGYAHEPGLRHVLTCGADFLVRCGLRSLRFVNDDGSVLPLADMLGASGGQLDRPVLVAPGKNQPEKSPFVARLVAFELPPEQAEKARRVQRQNAKREGYTPSREAQLVAGYLVLLTSVPPDEASSDDLRALYRLRWQIEIAFKRMKSTIGLNDLPNKDPDLAKAWLCCALILALLTEHTATRMLESFP